MPKHDASEGGGTMSGKMCEVKDCRRYAGHTGECWTDAAPPPQSAEQPQGELREAIKKVLQSLEESVASLERVCGRAESPQPQGEGLPTCKHGTTEGFCDECSPRLDSLGIIEAQAKELTRVRQQLAAIETVSKHFCENCWAQLQVVAPSQCLGCESSAKTRELAEAQRERDVAKKIAHSEAAERQKVAQESIRNGEADKARAIAAESRLQAAQGLVEEMETEGNRATLNTMPILAAERALMRKWAIRLAAALKG